MLRFNQSRSITVEINLLLLRDALCSFSTKFLLSTYGLNAATVGQMTGHRSPLYLERFTVLRETGSLQDHVTSGEFILY